MYHHPDPSRLLQRHPGHLFYLSYLSPPIDCFSRASTLALIHICNPAYPPLRQGESRQAARVAQSHHHPFLRPARSNTSSTSSASEPYSLGTWEEARCRRWQMGGGIDSGERAKGPAVLGTVEETHRSSVGTLFRVGMKAIENAPLVSRQRRVVGSTRTRGNAFEDNWTRSRKTEFKGGFDPCTSTAIATPGPPSAVFPLLNYNATPKLKSPSSEGWKERRIRSMGLDH
ncbi:hypothetical protein BKA70DRAFT_1223623 [Coprinopsis sp. MPI-PUGE-AT-0042]|nr:hypothetical protein BKA70DRAFT_1223623 [Coprinopsis sp. MPI-PUGE-AT-0042]